MFLARISNEQTLYKNFKRWGMNTEREREREKGGERERERERERDLVSEKITASD